MNGLESILNQNLHLTTNSSNNWCGVVCKVCNDHGNKGKRAGFRFEDNTTGYHCFNCGIKATHRDGELLSKCMMTILRAFDVPQLSINKLQFTGLSTRQSQHIIKSPIHHPKTIELPSHFYRFNPSQTDDMWIELATHYLVERHINITSQPFYLAHPNKNPYDNKWYGRIIIPYFYKDNLVFYQGRDLLDSRKRKYENASTSINTVLYGFDKLHTSLDTPIYVTEGFFNADVINGVGIFTNILSKEQIYHLTNSPRSKIIIPDYTGKGYRLAQQALKLGWSISLPNIHDCEDINKAVRRFGKLYVMSSIKKHTYCGDAAKLYLKLRCPVYTV